MNTPVEKLSARQRAEIETLAEDLGLRSRDREAGTATADGGGKVDWNRRTLDGALHGLLDQLSSDRGGTEAHSHRAAMVALNFARALGFSAGGAELVAEAVRYHDVGKAETPLEVLDKPGRLDDAERAIMNRHAEDGAKLIANLSLPAELGALQDFLETAAHFHHERYDGKGYPTGLAGTDIPLVARLTTIVDCYDALSGPKRVYQAASDRDPARPQRELHETLELMTSPQMIGHFDPGMLRGFVAHKLIQHGLAMRHPAEPLDGAPYEQHWRPIPDASLKALAGFAAGGPAPKPAEPSMKR